MRLCKRKRITSARINMTPMIDIVFLLIIFFMTVSQVSEINRERLVLPEQAGSDDQKPAILTININDVGEILVGGIKYPFTDLIALVADELARVGDEPSRLTVVVRADRRVPSRFVNRTVSALAQLDIRKVRIPVQVPD
jgi:biopolymer transport protein ExbD